MNEKTEKENIVEHVDVQPAVDTRDGEPTTVGVDTPPSAETLDGWEERYKQLQSIFTRQAQELSQLKQQKQEQATASVAKEQMPSAPVVSGNSDARFSRSFSGDCVQSKENSDGNAVRIAEGIDEGVGGITKNEPKSISHRNCQPPPPAVIGSGATFMQVGAREPRSMRETAQLAREYFSRK